MRRAFAITISVLSIALLTSTSRAHAQGGFDAEAQDTCEQAVEQQVKSGNPNAANIGYDTPRVAQVETVANVKGKGHFDGEHGKTGFSYTCVYKITTGDASDVHVNMSGNTASN